MRVQAEEAATALMRDHAEKRKIVPFARQFGATNIRRGLRDPGCVREKLETKLGRRVGYKIGLTSKRMQKMCGVNHPNSGVVFEKRLHPSGVTLPLSSLMRLGIEFECCARLGVSLRAARQALHA